MFKTALATKVVWCILPTVKALIKSLMFLISGLKTVSVNLFFLVKVKSQGHGVKWCGFTFFLDISAISEDRDMKFKIQVHQGIIQNWIFQIFHIFLRYISMNAQNLPKNRKFFNYPKMTSYFRFDVISR